MNATSRRTTIEDALDRLARKPVRSGKYNRYILLEELLDAEETRAGVLDHLLWEERQPATKIASYDAPELTKVWTDWSREIEVVLDDEVEELVDVELADDDDEVTLVRSFPPPAPSVLSPEEIAVSQPVPSLVPPPAPSFHDDRLATTYRVPQSRSRARMGVALLSSFLFGVLSTLVLTHAAWL